MSLPKNVTLFLEFNFFFCHHLRTTVHSGNANLLQNVNVLLMCIYLSTQSFFLRKMQCFLYRNEKWYQLHCLMYQ